MWESVVIAVILIAVIGLAALYVYRAKKSGKRCIGCPESGRCGRENSACGGGCQACNGGCGGCTDKRVGKL